MSAQQREQLLDRCQRLANEIAQIFIDAHHWNDTHPGAQPIDPDPTGELRRLHAGLVATLQAEVDREAAPQAAPKSAMELHQEFAQRRADDVKAGRRRHE